MKVKPNLLFDFLSSLRDIYEVYVASGCASIPSFYPGVGCLVGLLSFSLLSGASAR